MKLLLAGVLSPVHWAMIDRLERDGHQVTLLGHGAAPAPINAKAILHDISPNHASAQQVLRAGRFEAIVFFFAYQSDKADLYGSVHGALLDALFQFQCYAQENQVSNFFLVTDARVFGRGQKTAEMDTPIPNTGNGILIKAAEDCLRFSENGGPNTLLIRVSSLYASDSKDSFFDTVRKCAQEHRTMLVSGSPDTPCDFVHADDLAQFINIALSAEQVSGTIHLTYSKNMTYGSLMDAMKVVLPDLNVQYSQEADCAQTLQAGRAEAQLGWVPRHDCLWELEELIQPEKPKKEAGRAQRLRQQIRKSVKGRYMPWVELGIGASVAQVMMQLIERYALFRFLDVWLFYVILMGSLHGTFFGIVGAFIACVLYGMEWMATGKDAYLLVLDPDNWLPMMMYLLAGGAFGYIFESMRSQIALLEQERDQYKEETKFVESMYQQAYEDRNKLQEQVMRSRDSYGRIYSIARELDTLQPEQVFLSTLNVLEDTMQNQSVALYSAARHSSFLRLVVHSRSFGDRLGKSLDLKQYPILEKSIQAGELFMNTNLEPGYPALAAPVLQNKEILALVVLWDVPFEKQTLYYRNLFNVVVGLVQSSMVRALQFFETADDVYLAGTTILGDKAFRAAMSVYRSMRKQRASNFLLLRVEDEEGALSLQAMGERLRHAVRTTDICGRLNTGIYYALLPQASLENLPQIDRRFRSAGLKQTVAALESIDG